MIIKRRVATLKFHDDPDILLTDLAEGNHWVSAVAASGARVSSEQVGTRVLKVDKTDPVTTLMGLPNEWVDHPVTLTAAAVDADSGMAAKAGDDGDPVTVIRAGHSAPYVSPGDTATFTVADEGSTRIQFWARDLAGNINDGVQPGEEKHAAPGTATVRIDRRPPTVEFSRRVDPGDPELFRATVRDTDSGLDFGTISYRAVGGKGEFTKLETETEGNHLAARMPSDDLASGGYLLRAEATDRAGNVGDTASSGSGMTVSVPLKRAVRLTASYGTRKRPAARSTASYGERSHIQGRLTNGGRPVAGARLVIDERFATGSRRKMRWTRLRTDGTGRYATSVKAGPSRMIRVRYAGSRTNRRTSSRELRLTVKDRISFGIEPRVLRNRGRVTMSGRVEGKGALKPSAGKLVAIQYFDPSRARWRPVEVLKANRRGAFRYEYRFRTIDYAQRIIFRAVSLPEAGWPYASSTSRRRSVIVYPAG